MRPVLFVLVPLLLGPPVSGVGAQETEPLRFEIVSGTGEARIEVANLLSEPSLLEAVQDGLPLRIRIVVQLWKDGFFDNQKGAHEWRASLIFDPLTRRYRVQTDSRPGVEEEVNTLEEVRAALQQTLSLPLRPPEPGRYYYQALVEMETLSLSDLEELQRWLQGELAPAVAGEQDVEGALAKGFRRVLVRMLGLPARRFEVQSRTFSVGDSPAGGMLPEMEGDLRSGG